VILEVSTCTNVTIFGWMTTIGGSSTTGGIDGKIERSLVDGWIGKTTKHGKVVRCTLLNMHVLCARSAVQESSVESPIPTLAVDDRRRSIARGQSWLAILQLASVLFNGKKYEPSDADTSKIARGLA
jgi:hypothetical protein